MANEDLTSALAEQLVPEMATAGPVRRGLQAYGQWWRQTVPEQAREFLDELNDRSHIGPHMLNDVAGGFGGAPLGHFPTGALAGIFAGRGALTADKVALQRAIQMAGDQAEPEAIRQATGWFRGPEGAWRFEIPDNNAEFAGQLAPRLRGGTAQGSVGEFIDHPDLLRAYPKLARLPMTVNERAALASPTGNLGSAGLTLNVPPGGLDQAALATAMHELQHGVQDAEGFSPGGSPYAIKSQYPDFYGDALGDATDRIMAEIGPDTHPSAEDWEGVRQQAAYDAYHRLAGEIEARDVAARQALTPEERAQIPPYSSYSAAEDGEPYVAPPRARVDGLTGAASAPPGGALPPELAAQAAEANRLRDARLAGIDLPHYSFSDAAGNGDIPLVDGPGALDMSAEARLQRAAEQGYLVPGYHGTDAPENFSAFDRTNDLGYHFAATPDAANERLAQIRGDSGDIEGQRIIPAMLRMQNPLRLPDLFTWRAGDVINHLDGHLPPEDIDALWQAHDAGDADPAIREALQRNGYDGIVYRNATEGGGDSYMALDPSQIRSRFAAFDPARAGDPDMMASVSREDFLGQPELDMSEAARLQRAREQGYTIDAYHGTQGDFSAFDPETIGSHTGPHVAGFTFTDDPAMASNYAKRGIGEAGMSGGAVMPVKLRMQNPLNFDFASDPRAGNPFFLPDDVARYARQNGHDGAIIRGFSDPGGDGTQYVVFDPSQIRSRFAAFDPRRAGSGNLLAGAAGLGLGIPLASFPGYGGDASQ